MRPALRIVRFRRLVSAALWGCILSPALVGQPSPGLNPERAIAQYAHTSWRMQEGYFNGRVRSVTQTTDGYIWFATRSELFRFDGIRFVPWTPPQGAGLAPRNIHSIQGGRDGSLWIAGRDGLFRWQDQKLQRIAGVPGPVTEITQDREGTIWVARGVGDVLAGPICRVTGNAGRCLDETDGIPSSINTGESLTTDEKGAVWMGTTEALVQWRGASAKIYRPPGLIANHSSGIVALASARDGSMWVGMPLRGKGLGLEHLTAGRWEALRTPQLDGSRLTVTDLFLDRSGALWIGSGDKGIFRYWNGRIDHFGSAEGLSSNFVGSFFEDREGGLWIVTSEGVDRFHDLSVTTWSEREGLTTDNVVSVAADRDGGVWVGNAGGLDRIDLDVVSSIRSGQGLPGNQVRAIYEDRAKRLWLGIDNDLVILEHGQFRKVHRTDGAPVGSVNTIAEDLHGNLWVDSNSDKELIRIVGSTVREEFALPQIKSSHVLTADFHGNLWIGLRNGGLARFRNGSTETVQFPLSQPSRVRQVLASEDGTILAATSAGMLVWHAGAALVLDIRSGLPCSELNGVILDNAGNLWMHTACGLIEIESRQFARWLEFPMSRIGFRTFDVFDGMQPGNAFYEPAARSADGRLWFANGNVLQMIDPANLVRNRISPPVRVEEIVADRRHYSTGGSIVLPELTRDLEIDYTALSFVAPRKMRFRYQLVGHDKDWQDAGARRQAFYTDLPPGNYQFRVIASNNDGIWNEAGANAYFVIAPAIYQTPWFRVFCFIAAGTLFWIVYWLHLNRVTRRIQDQLAARMEERERIARELHDTLLQGFHGLMLRFQSVLKNIPPASLAKEMMESALDRADAVLLEGRQRVQGLREGGLTGDGLWDQLVQWGGELASLGTTRFSASVVGTPRPLNPTVCNEVYQIGREALSNAFRHSSAMHIEMEITYSRKSMRLIVRDDGCGMDDSIVRSGKAGHWGIFGMRERARQIGAQFNIWTSSEAGTEVEIRIAAKLADRRVRRAMGLFRLPFRIAR